MECPGCGGRLAPHRPGWWACGTRGCGYELHDAAATLYRSLAAEYDADPRAFFDRVRRRRDELRAAEPVWRRRP